MAYELHIRPRNYDHEAPETHLTFKSFEKAVGIVKNCRMREGFPPARGPQAEVRFPEYRQWWFWVHPEEWIPVFWFSSGAIDFKAGISAEESSDPVRFVAAELATHLECRIEGDDGEFYVW